MSLPHFDKNHQLSQLWWVLAHELPYLPFVGDDSLRDTFETLDNALAADANDRSHWS